MIGTAVYAHHGLQDNIDMESGETLYEKRRKKELEFEAIQQKYFEIIDKNLLIKYLRAAHADLQEIFREIDHFVRSTEKENAEAGISILGCLRE